MHNIFVSHKILLILLGLLAILFIRVFSAVLSVTPYPQGQKVTFQTAISQTPKFTSRGQRVSLELPNSQRISVLFPLFPTLSYGDSLKVEGEVKYFKSENGTEIAYMDYPRFEIVTAGGGNLLNVARDRLVEFFHNSMGQRESVLMLGIVFGIKEEMPKDFYSSLQTTGLLHVIAASGMNITLLAGFLVGFFSLFLRRQYALVVSIFGILFYALLAGFQPSIVRAAIMGILVFTAQIAGRQNSAFLGLFMAGFIMLFKTPALIFDIGFQLSFTATLGLIYLRPVFIKSPKIKKIIEKSVVGEDLLTTISAQISTLPILLGSFGTYGLTSIIVNALVLWTVPPLMIIGGISAIFGLIFAPLGQLIGFLALPLLFYFEWVVEIFGSFGAVWKINSLPISIALGYYLLIFSLILLANRHGNESK